MDRQGTSIRWVGRLRRPTQTLILAWAISREVELVEVPFCRAPQLIVAGGEAA